MNDGYPMRVKSQEIFRQRGVTIFGIEETETNRISKVTAQEIFIDKTWQKKLSPHDLFLIAYVAGEESILRER